MYIFYLPCSDLRAAAPANEGNLPAEPGEAGVQLSGVEEERRREHHHQVTAEEEDHQVRQQAGRLAWTRPTGRQTGMD